MKTIILMITAILLMVSNPALSQSKERLAEREARKIQFEINMLLLKADEPLEPAEIRKVHILERQNIILKKENMKFKSHQDLYFLIFILLFFSSLFAFFYFISRNDNDTKIQEQKMELYQASKT